MIGSVTYRLVQLLVSKVFALRYRLQIDYDNGRLFEPQIGQRNKVNVFTLH